MSTSAKSDGLLPAGLLLLGLVPMAAGLWRLVQVGGGAAITPDNARFMAAPVPVVLHIVSALLFSTLGALQFAPGLRRGQLGWHRLAGRWLVPLGLVAALSGLWMTQFYPAAPLPPASFDGTAVYAMRWLAGSGMVLSLCLGLAAVWRRDVPSHQAWMLRGYALGLGAGTQVFTHLPWFLFPSLQGELARALCMGAGWAINLAVAQWLIVRAARQRQRPSQSSSSRVTSAGCSRCKKCPASATSS